MTQKFNKIFRCLFLTLVFGIPFATSANPIQPVSMMIAEFNSMTSLQRERWQETNESRHWVSGTCEVHDVNTTSWLSEFRSPEADYVVDCVINSTQHVSLYFANSYNNVMQSLSTGEMIEFEGKLKTIRHWGFWSTAYVLVQETPQSSSSSEYNNNQAPQFQNYPATRVLPERQAQAILNSDISDTFRAKLHNALEQPANFAGEYVLTAWGCGSSCLDGAVVSLRTGQVVSLPGTICCWKGEGERLIIRPDSRLLVAAGLINESGEHGAHFYEFTDDEFEHIVTIPVNRQ